MKAKKRHFDLSLLFKVISWAGLVCFAAAFALSGTAQWVMATGGVIGLLAGLVLQMLFWRCPHCDHTLPQTPQYHFHTCPFCGGGVEE